VLVHSDPDNYFQLKILDKFMMGHNGFIAGGCFKNLFNGERVKDIDVFFENTNDFEAARVYFDSQEEDYYFFYENPNVYAYKHRETNTTVELCRKVFGTADEVISAFDFSIVKFAYYKTEEDDTGVFPDGEKRTVYKVALDDKFFEHLHLKRLVVDDKLLYPMSTFERMIRYIKYGYMPCQGTKLRIAQGVRGLTDDAMIVAASLYDGID
jgi:hypothetical protein